MLETLIFILGQLILNIVVWKLPTKTDGFKYFYASLAPLMLSMTMMTFPFWSFYISELIFPPEPKIKGKCGMPFLGGMVFQFIFGTIAVYYIQKLLNDKLFKIIIETRDKEDLENGHI